MIRFNVNFVFQFAFFAKLLFDRVLVVYFADVSAVITFAIDELERGFKALGYAYRVPIMRNRRILVSVIRNWLPGSSISKPIVGIDNRYQVDINRYLKFFWLEFCSFLYASIVYVARFLRRAYIHTYIFFLSSQ